MLHGHDPRRTRYSFMPRYRLLDDALSFVIIRHTF